MIKWDLVWLSCLLVILALLWFIHPAPAHSWYDLDCCHDNDCHQIDSCEELHEQPDGSYTWTDHNEVKYTIRKDRVRASHDSHCHVCTMMYGGMPVGICAYIITSF